MRETIKRGTIELDVEGEIAVTAANNQTILIPYNSAWKTVMIQVSGGLDSALLAFLTAREYAAMGLETKIQPLSFEVEAKAKTLNSARKIIAGIKEKLNDYDRILPGIEKVIPYHLCKNPHKNQEFIKGIKEAWRQASVDFEFNGNTKNPPAETRESFANNDGREVGRDDRSTIYNGFKSASPLALVDKQAVVSLHHKYGLFEAVTRHTLSCDMEEEVVKAKGWSVPCGHCWWCYERAWGFESNGLQDPAN
ncbi:MAG: 7-cyano-7-deazaguanine synthase [Bdellovibrionales bacterium]|nr:7-cyano-7-deazaguanine synthase [Bdellovibrionales bacterium]